MAVASAVITLVFLFTSTVVNAQTGPLVNAKPPTERVAVFAPKPDYPLEARRHRLGGSGIAVLEVDKQTGQVSSALMQPSTGHKILDDAALDAFKRWRCNPKKMEQLSLSSGFKPTPSTFWKVKIPLTYTLAKATY